MKKAFTLISFLLLWMGGFAQSNLERIPIPDAGHSFIPDSSDLRIQSEHGWHLCAGGELLLFTDYEETEIKWLYNGEALNVVESEIIVKEGGYYQLQTMEGDSVLYSEEVEVIVYEPQVPTIEQNGNVLTASPAKSYQWFHDNIVIENAIEQDLYLLDSGEYYVETIDENGCLAVSKIVSLTIANIHEVSLQAIDTYPSPARDVLLVTPINIDNQDFTLSVFDNNGRLVLKVSDRLRDNQPIELNLQNLPSGMYLVQFLGEHVQVIEKISKM